MIAADDTLQSRYYRLYQLVICHSVYVVADKLGPTIAADGMKIFIPCFPTNIDVLFVTEVLFLLF